VLPSRGGTLVIGFNRAILKEDIACRPEPREVGAADSQVGTAPG